jgi:hypothetical protein
MMRSSPGTARLLAVIFLVAAIGGFLPRISPPAPFDAEVITLDRLYVFAFGVFPVNLVHDLIHGVFAVWGAIAGLRFRWARRYCRIVFWTYLVLALIGAVPLIDTFFGIVPLYGWDVLLHLGIALVAAWGGYGRASREPEQPSATAAPAA